MHDIFFRWLLLVLGAIIALGINSWLILGSIHLTLSPFLELAFLPAFQSAAIAFGLNEVGRPRWVVIRDLLRHRLVGASLVISLGAIVLLAFPSGASVDAGRFATAWSGTSLILAGGLLARKPRVVGLNKLTFAALLIATGALLISSASSWLWWTGPKSYPLPGDLLTLVVASLIGSSWASVLTKHHSSGAREAFGALGCATLVTISILLPCLFLWPLVTTVWLGWCRFYLIFAGFVGLSGAFALSEATRATKSKVLPAERPLWGQLCLVCLINVTAYAVGLFSLAAVWPNAWSWGSELFTSAALTLAVQALLLGSQSLVRLTIRRSWQQVPATVTPDP